MAKAKSFIGFLESRIQYLSECDRQGTANNYRRAKSSLLRFLDGKDLTFRELNICFIDSYEDWLMKRGMKRNTVSFHMRILRAVYNKGVRKGLTTQTYPFSEAYTGVDRTGKRSVDIAVVKKLRNYDFGRDKKMSLTRDMFLFSLYTRGMSFIDMAYLRHSDIRDGEIVYVRKKTKGVMRIKVEKDIGEIINRYRGGEYVFPVLENVDSSKVYCHYLRALSRYNYRLKKLSEKIGLGRRLTSYVSRHTWASLAYKMDIPVSVISNGMGHKTETVTRIYLDSLEHGTIDRANALLLKKLRL